MKLLFVRHATTEQNDLGMKGIIGHDDILNSEGIKQAQNASRICNMYFPTAMYSSAFLRSKQTAEIIAEVSGLNVVLTDDLQEFDVGERSSLTIEKAQKKLQQDRKYLDADDKYRVRVSSGESWEDVHNRVKHYIDEVIATHGQDETIVCVTHNVVLKVVVGVLEELPFESWLPILLPTASVTAYEYSGGHFKNMFRGRVE